MLDFHSHILPDMDDGAEDILMSLAMLRQSFTQGVDVVVATSHFYGDEEQPKSFLQRRKEMVSRLEDAMLLSEEVYPQLLLGAEVLYFPGIGEAEEISQLNIGNTPYILIEPPMCKWTDTMLEDISGLSAHFACMPVIAHVDRYMRCLREDSLIDRLRERGLLVQVNTSFFLNPETSKKAISFLKQNKIQAVGTDCHNLYSRVPNLGQVQRMAKKEGFYEAWKQLHDNTMKMLLPGGN